MRQRVGPPVGLAEVLDGHRPILIAVCGQDLHGALEGVPLPYRVGEAQAQRLLPRLQEVARPRREDWLPAQEIEGPSVVPHRASERTAKQRWAQRECGAARCVVGSDTSYRPWPGRGRQPDRGLTPTACRPPMLRRPLGHILSACVRGSRTAFDAALVLNCTPAGKSLITAIADQCSRTSRMRDSVMRLRQAIGGVRYAVRCESFEPIHTHSGIAEAGGAS